MRAFFLLTSVLVIACAGEPFTAVSDNALGGGSSGAGSETSDEPMSTDSGGQDGAPDADGAGEGGSPAAEPDLTTHGGTSFTRAGSGSASSDAGTAGDSSSAGAGGTPDAGPPCATGVRFRGDAMKLGGTLNPFVSVDVTLNSKPYTKIAMVEDTDPDAGIFDGCIPDLVIEQGDTVLFVPHTRDGASPCGNDENQTWMCGQPLAYTAFIYGNAVSVAAVCKTACQASGYWALGATFAPADQ